MSLGVAVASAVESSRPQIDALGHELVLRIPERPLEVDADLGRLSQVFSNLLNNAAKYTERGGRIIVAVERDGRDALVRVRDSGIGLEPGQIPHIFEMFAQVDGSLERRQGGLGVGLSLSKRLIELHGGRIEVHSAGLGTGSEFVVHLPALGEAPVEPVQPAPRGDEAHTHPPRRVLVADDNVDSAHLLALALGDAGHDVRVAHDGRAALDLAGSFHPDAAFLDIGMPEVNGYEVARRIRSARGADVLLVAVTGWGQASDRQRASEAGFDHHLTKPVDLPGLLALLK